MFDLFGSYSRYERRNRGSVVKAEFEAAGAPDKDAGPYCNMNLQNLFSEPVWKVVTPPVSPPVSKPVKKPVSKRESDIGKLITDLMPIRITKAERCEGSACLVRKSCA